jgi:hypothetical protein
MSLLGGPGWLGPLDVVPAAVSLEVAEDFAVDLGGLFSDGAVGFFTKLSFQCLPKRKSHLKGDKSRLRRARRAAPVAVVASRGRGRTEELRRCGCEAPQRLNPQACAMNEILLSVRRHQCPVASTLRQHFLTIEGRRRARLVGAQIFGSLPGLPAFGRPSVRYRTLRINCVRRRDRHDWRADR